MPEENKELPSTPPGDNPENPEDAPEATAGDPQPDNNQDADAESQQDAATAETPEGGSEAAAEAGGQEPAQPQSPTGEALLELVAGDPEAQRALQQRLASGLEVARTQQQERARQAELGKLIEEERYDDIGRQFVQEQQQAAVRSQADEEAMREVYGNIYRQLFQHPAMQNLSAEDRATLDPQKYETDTEYVLALTSFINLRSQGQKIDELGNQRANSVLEALKNQKTAETVNSNSVGSLPPATEHTEGPKSSSDLIAAGWADQLNQEQE